MRPSRIEWVKPDAYHATFEDWSIALCIVAGEEWFVLWSGRMSRSRMPNRVPIRFANAGDAVKWVRWIEDNAPAYQKNLADVGLTREQREVI